MTFPKGRRLISRPINAGTKHILTEQLRLFAFDDSPLPAHDVLIHFQQELSKREILAALLEGELNFHGEDSGYASHDLHSFAAKFPPQLPRVFIRGLTDPGDIVLDPMMGSGTTLVEALLEGRQGIGLDIDPLALRLGRAKTTTIDTHRLRDAGQKVLTKANHLLLEKKSVDQSLSQFFDDQTRAFLDYWFLPDTQRELMALILAIKDIQDEPSRHFLDLTFSSIIITKSGGVSRARDLAHSRPHLDNTKLSKNALEQFSLRLRKNLNSIEELNLNGLAGTIIAGDARSMPLADGIIDLIVTSPPYANAIDYMRAHKFSLVWFGKSISDLSKLRAGYIGSERTGQIHDSNLPDRPQRVLQVLQKCDQKKAAILQKYLVEMKTILSEMLRILRRNSAAIVVVGTSIMRGIDIQTHYCLADIAAELGFDVVGVKQRILDRNKRMMPARFGRKADSMIEQRMHEEYIIGLLKPESSKIG
ncbi:MAG TPA: DNA methyltransferase [Thermodesulfobacteriota bacterium]|nr:DNA methyltransferase [Thermodesulfobacteriota bacterium]